MKKFTIKNGKYGKRLILCSKLTEEIIGYCIDKDIKELELNYAKGYKAENLSLLKDLTHLLAFEILDYPDYSLDEIHYLRNLKELTISCYDKTPINLTQFRELENLSIYWRKGVIALDKLSNLKELFIYMYTPASKDLSEISKIESLEKISLKMPKIESIGNLENLSNLNFLGIYGATKLKNIDGLETLKNLKTLELDTCRKINNLEIIGKLTSLEKLRFTNSGKIESLKPLCNLKNLTQVDLIESTNILDGDISVLTRLPKIRRLLFQDRKHYNLKKCEF